MTLRIMNSYGPLNITFQTFFIAQGAHIHLAATGANINRAEDDEFHIQLLLIDKAWMIDRAQSVYIMRGAGEREARLE